MTGAAVTGISFEHREAFSGTTGYRQPNICIDLDNGVRIRFTTDFGEVPEENTSIYFEREK